MTMPKSTKKLPSWFEEEKHGKAGLPKTAGERTKQLSPDPAAARKPGISGDEKTRTASDRRLFENLKDNPAPLVLAVLALFVLGTFWFVVLEEPASDQASVREEVESNSKSAVNPFSSGAIRDSDVTFDGLEVKDGEATLKGAGLEWSGIVSDKEGGGETVTLEGPTAAQLERGFDLGQSSIETGVYAIAQRSGEVLHVTTHSLETSESIGDTTLGTVYALDNGELSGYAYYLDERDGNSERITRTYVIPGKESYRVSFEAEPGTFVPLLVGWRGFDSGSQQDFQEQQGGQ
ncbi:hypothetical protein [Rubrobacter indicoceani]|uniref:hypothetical protein n=1 Tax=Rubrobacter indicoceani TaxID=2051957 RepID=UPI0013C53733|nr:hypothetical protein [Rubrobacter indicoceani]